MQHTVTNVVAKEQIDILRSIKNASLLRLYIEEAGEFVLDVVIESPDHKVSIKNTPIYASDNDEYPKLKIAYTQTLNPEYKLAYTGTSIEDIFILRDVVSWETQGVRWMVETDIAIKLVFKEEELLLVAQDSLAGFFEVFKLNKIMPVKGILNDYWSMKTDKIKSLVREEIKV